MPGLLQAANHCGPGPSGFRQADNWQICLAVKRSKFAGFPNLAAQGVGVTKSLSEGLAARAAAENMRLVMKQAESYFLDV